MIQVEVWSDINCPFCYIGKRHLEKAIKEFSSAEVSVEWKSFELDPLTKPPKNISHKALLAQKYGKDIAWAERMDENLTHMAKKAGLDFHMDKIIPANSLNAHRLIHLAKDHGKQNEMKERLLAAKFVEGLDIDDLIVLRNLAVGLGLNRDEVIGVLETNRYEAEVRRDEETAGALGISGVPFFVINKKYGLSGAQPVETFIEAFKEAQEK